MKRSEEDARVRELKRILGSFSEPLEFRKNWSRIGVYYGKADRQRPAFRAYESRRDSYSRTKREYDALRAELLTLQDRARRRHAA